MKLDKDPALTVRTMLVTGRSKGREKKGGGREERNVNHVLKVLSVVCLVYLQVERKKKGQKRRERYRQTLRRWKKKRKRKGEEKRGK